MEINYNAVLFFTSAIFVIVLLWTRKSKKYKEQTIESDSTKLNRLTGMMLLPHAKYSFHYYTNAYISSEDLSTNPIVDKVQLDVIKHATTNFDIDDINKIIVHVNTVELDLPNYFNDIIVRKITLKKFGYVRQK